MIPTGYLLFGTHAMLYIDFRDAVPSTSGQRLSSLENLWSGDNGKHTVFCTISVSICLYKYLSFTFRESLISLSTVGACTHFVGSSLLVTYRFLDGSLIVIMF